MFHSLFLQVLKKACKHHKGRGFAVLNKVKMDKIKDAIQGMIDEAESKSELPPEDILEEAVEISGTLTFGLISLLAKAIRTLKSAVQEEEIKMQLQDQLRDTWGANAPDLDVSI